MIKRPLAFIVTAVFSVAIVSCSSTGGDAAKVELSDKPLTGKFVWHDLITDDVEGARAFYGDLFGWTFETTTREDTGDYTLIIANGRYVGGMVGLADPQNADYSRWLGYLSVDSVDRAADQAATAGGKVLVKPRNLAVARAAAITDPDGAVLGIARSKAGDPLDRPVQGKGEVVWNELLAANPEKMAGFYRSLAGFEVKSEPNQTGTYHYLTSQGRDRAGIMERPNVNVQPVWLTHFSVTDAKAAASKVSALGGTVLLDASPDLRDGALAVVTDPAGALLALHRVDDQEAP